MRGAQFDLAIVQRREVSLMVRGLDRDLVRPDAADAHERPVPMLSDLADPIECGEFVGDATDRPTRSVSLPAVSVREDLRWRHRLVALAERAALLRRRILRIPEGTGPLGTGRGEHDPGGRRFILADFRHEAPRAVGAPGHIEDCGAVRTLFTNERDDRPRLGERRLGYIIERSECARWRNRLRTAQEDGHASRGRG